MRDKREDYDDADDYDNSKIKGDHDLAFSDRDPFQMGAQDLEDFHS